MKLDIRFSIFYLLEIYFFTLKSTNMSKCSKCNLNAMEICSLRKKENNLDMASCITIVPVLIHNKTPIVTLKREKARNVMFAKQLQIEARKAKLISLYGTNDLEKIKPKTRREYIEEFIINTINDSTFISIN